MEFWLLPEGLLSTYISLPSGTLLFLRQPTRNSMYDINVNGTLALDSLLFHKSIPNGYTDQVRAGRLPWTTHKQLIPCNYVE